MKNNQLSTPFSTFLIYALFFMFYFSSAQQSQGTNSKTDFWNNVQFGGGLGLSIGTGYTDISISPSAIYNFNEYFSLGAGAQYTYAKQKNYYTSNLYGASLIALVNPIEQIQLSAELEQLRVNVSGIGLNTYENNFWNTGLFLGAGYRSGNATIGARYNVLYKNNQGAYSDAFMPFVRFYF